jgi:hypothetical protein
MGIVNNKEQTMYQELTKQEQWQVRAYGATESQVREALDSYLRSRNRVQIVADIMTSGWIDINRGDYEDAVQTLNRAKLAITEWFDGDSRDFFTTRAGQVMSILSDAQELIGMEDYRRAQMCMDTAVEIIRGYDKQ